jgi:aminoglycoside phosphotransferase family enzyme/predicted kinase
MTTSNDQAELIQAMQDEAFYPHAVDRLTCEETHISWVFLTGSFVYKVKKPVELGFLDFTTLDQREYYCRREVELNRRLTEGVYLGVVPIGRNESGYQLGGSAPPVEYAVKMRQLSAADSLRQLLAHNRIDSGAVDLLARSLSRFYGETTTNPGIDRFGSLETITENCEENFRQTAETAANVIDQRRFEIIASATRGFLEDRRDIFENRITDGWIRDCHGDLRTDHIYYTPDGIQIIDCIEFNDRFRCSDVISDLAFLAMELDFEGYPRVAGTLMTGFVEHASDQHLFSLLDFYKCYRAMVRLKVNCFRLQQPDIEDEERDRLLDEIHRYLDLAYRYAVQFSRPMLWVVCGMVASGKSTIARALADSLCISVLRSDVVRQRLFETTSLKSGVVDFGEGVYSPEATSMTYGQLLLQAQAQIDQGRSVVLDATFSRKNQRREILRLADEMRAAVVFVECTCSEATARKRLQARAHTHSVSDARIDHLNKLKAAFETLDDLSEECHVRVDTEENIEDNLRTALAFISTPKDCLKRRWMP